MKETLGDRIGINRYGTAFVPIDETLGIASLDLSERSYLVFGCELDSPKLDSFDIELVKELLQTLTFNIQVSLHLKVLHGKNDHHRSGNFFKATGRVLREAITTNPEVYSANSTKGLL